MQTPQGQVLLITGASRGIGAATARLAAVRGYRLALNYHSRDDVAEALAQELRATGTDAICLRADVGDESSVVHMFERIDRELGPIQGLVNNAGILETQAKLADMDSERLHRVFQVNVIGSFLCAREAVRRMSTARGGEGGVIVNVSSMASKLGSPGEYIDYAASKGAVDSMTLGLAREVAAEGIRVNAVRPGIIATDIHADGGEPGRVDRLGPQQPLGRGGEPEEVAEAILWLLSDASSYTTGSFIDVSGGR